MCCEIWVVVFVISVGVVGLVVVRVIGMFDFGWIGVDFVLVLWRWVVVGMVLVILVWIDGVGECGLVVMDFCVGVGYLIFGVGSVFIFGCVGDCLVEGILGDGIGVVGIVCVGGFVLVCVCCLFDLFCVGCVVEVVIGFCWGILW